MPLPMRKKRRGYQRQNTTKLSICRKKYPKRYLNGAGITAAGFAAIWHILWLAIVGLVGAFVVFLFRAYNNDVDYYVQPR